MKQMLRADFRPVVIILIGTFFLYVLSFYAAIPVTEENLQKFYELTETDPLFYDPAMDVDFLRSSVDKMKKRDDLILYVDQLYRPNQHEKHRDVFPVGWRLWPDKFLAVLPDIHIATENFLNSSSPENALALLNLYDEAAVNYKEAIDLHIDALDAIIKKNPKAKNTKVIFLGSGTASDIVKKDFVIIQKNAEALKEEITARKKCLLLGKCIASYFDNIFFSNVSGVFIPFEPLPKDILGIKEEGKDYAGPFWATTGCFGFGVNGNSKSLPFYLKIRPSDYQDEPFVIPMLTNIKYYRDYAQTPGSATAEIAAAEGIQIQPHSETTDYMCTDLTYLPELILNYLEEKKGIRSEFSRQNKLAAMPYLIQNTIRVSFPLIYYPQYTGLARLPLDFLITRSAYSLYFGTFSPAVWRTPERPEFLLKENFDFRSGYTTYEDLLNRGMSQEEITTLNDLPSTRNIYREVISGE